VGTSESERERERDRARERERERESTLRLSFGPPSWHAHAMRLHA
jgi:hypothetical protein